VIERRRTTRMRATGVRARVRAGPLLVVIDVSPDGALVEGGPLRPGSFVDLHVESDRREARFKARVVRCNVAAIGTICGITYRAGLSFDETCSWVCEHGTLRESEVPERRSE
jgi:hypothetical protein